MEKVKHKSLNDLLSKDDSSQSSVKKMIFFLFSVFLSNGLFYLLFLMQSNAVQVSAKKGELVYLKVKLMVPPNLKSEVQLFDPRKDVFIKKITIVEAKENLTGDWYASLRIPKDELAKIKNFDKLYWLIPMGSSPKLHRNKKVFYDFSF
ncbi:MAG: hypothetical protein ACI9QD_001231 [Thermoproteota archaeon]|jgi:hypothetical protein